MQRVSKHGKILKDLKLMERKRVRKHVYYHLTTLGLEVNNIIDVEGLNIPSKPKRKSKQKQGNTQYLIRKDHTRELKKVIDRLISEIPVISMSGAINIKNPLTKRAYKGEDFEVEINDNLRIQDLFSNHLKFDKKVLPKKLIKFKNKTKEFWLNKEAIRNEIWEDFQKGLHYQELKSTYSEFFNKSIRDWIYRNALIFIKHCNNPDKNPIILEIQQKINFLRRPKRKLRDKKGKIIHDRKKYLLSPYPFLNNLHNEKFNENDIKHAFHYLNGYLRNFDQKVYYSNLQRNLKLLKEISKLRDEIVLSLDKNKLTQLFPGECEYLSS
jgi:hypothetical protein